MAGNPSSESTPVSREEFDTMKNQMAEIAKLLKEQLKIKLGPQPEDPPWSSAQGQSWRPNNGPPTWANGNNLQLPQLALFNQSQGGQRKFERTDSRRFTPLGDSLENVLALLVAQGKITELAPPIDSRSKRFDPRKRCTYHSESPGHDTQDCWSLKHKIQNLIDRGDIVVGQPKQPNVNADRLPQPDTEGENVIGSGSIRADPNCKYIQKIEEYPHMSGENALGEIKIIKQQVKTIRHPVKQLADLVVHQSQITRQLFTQLTKSQEKEGDEQNANRNPSQMIQLTEEDQSRLKGQGRRNNEILRQPHLWSLDNRADKCEPPKGKGRAISTRDRECTPLNKSKAEILHLLISRGKITELLPHTDPKSERYDPTLVCLYHSNSPGHDTEECWALQHKIQNLIDGGDQIGAITKDILDVGITSSEGSIADDERIDESQPPGKW